MKILVIPDIHGNYAAALQNIQDHKDEVDKVVWLGDGVDDFNENLNGQTMIDGLNKLIEFKNNEPNKFELLLGNHDLSYLAQTRNGECVSGHHYEYADMYKKAVDRIFRVWYKRQARFGNIVCAPYDFVKNFYHRKHSLSNGGNRHDHYG